MLNMKRALGLLFIIAISGCSKDDKPEPIVDFFKREPVTKPVSPSFPGEVSGMADSYSRAGFIWMLQDGGTPAELLTLSYNGEQGPTLKVTGAENQDWEDMAISNGPESGKKYIYIGDIGDNNRLHDFYYIYRLQEPAAGELQTAVPDKFSFVYDDGQKHDADAFLVDGATNNILIFTKEQPTLIFQLSYPYNSASINIAVKTGQLPQPMITGAAISPDGNEILLRTYTSLYYWKRQQGQTILAALEQPAREITITSEPQGESVGFKADNTGFFTFSEKAGLPLQLNLYYYPRN